MKGTLRFERTKAHLSPLQTVAAKLVNATADKSRDELEQQCQELRSRDKVRVYMLLHRKTQYEELCEDFDLRFFVLQSNIHEHQAEIAKLKQSYEDSMMRLKEQHEEKAS